MKNNEIINNKAEQNENFIISVGKGLQEVWDRKWKSIFIGIYAVIAIYLWNMRHRFFDLFMFNMLPPLIFSIVKISFNLATGIMLILGLFQIIIYIGKDKKSEDLQSTLGEISPYKKKPVVAGKRPYKYKGYGTVYKIKNYGLGTERIKQRANDIEGIVNAKVYDVRNARNRRGKINSHYTDILTINWENFKPKVIKLKDDDLDSDLIFIRNMVVIGATGEGKSFFCRYWLGKVAFYYKARNLALSIWILDHKNSDEFRFAEGTDNYYSYGKVYEGLLKVYAEYKRRVADADYRAKAPKIIVFIDEFSVLCASSPKNVSDDIKTKVFELLSMGRSMKVIPVLRNATL